MDGVRRWMASDAVANLAEEIYVVASREVPGEELLGWSTGYSPGWESWEMPWKEKPWTST